MPSPWERSKILCSIPVAVLVIIAALDSADKALLGASFPMLEKNLGLHVDTLGYFSLFTNLSYALCLPFWGFLVHRYTVQHAHNILCISCFLWGVATLSIAQSETVVSQAFFRSLNGAALASILPLSQMMLVDLVPSTMRGSAFGLMGFLEKAAATLATSAVVWYDDWRIPYLAVGSASVLMAIAAKIFLQMKTKVKEDETTNGEELSLLGIFKRISRIPIFVYLVAQGVFGAIPWDIMSFVLLLLEWKGFTKEQIISFQFAGGIFGMFGAFLGGLLGDYFAHLPHGRTNVAVVSVLSGILFYGLFLYSETYHLCIVWHSLFHLMGGWCPAAACRPICADLAQNQVERAQIVAAWVLLEKTSSSIFGAPLVGFLTKRLFDENLVSTNQEKARVLARNIFLLSTFFWGICGYFWFIMGRSEQHRNEMLFREKEEKKKGYAANRHV
mmetsp:Transcript_15074/g.32707  ORF Transcript_15074/g.32707 Transcript_15074/m.32707 type:complete len:444 (-) Transcript_15074:358-1689(-)|eukprot:CAMPEP_0172325384 /NCGR_PEP_ID=MMETSP1058-20130122/53895_1 /TAXON_ID=83371 /ORGANISM="Detonula confervacea, Strain CCMP 353" /LENGTH=443 /DNA_ID=CAMNT_0013041919 /DNA_START=106 /DNA_END=1437 /DNA_ORIENTATION=+